MVILFTLSSIAYADSPYETEWKWIEPTERVDGSAYDPATETDRYELHCGRDDPSDIFITDAPGGTDNKVVDMDETLSSYGRYDCVMRTVDVDGLISDWSEPVQYVHHARPHPPIDFRRGR